VRKTLEQVIRLFGDLRSGAYVHLLMNHVPTTLEEHEQTVTVTTATVCPSHASHLQNRDDFGRLLIENDCLKGGGRAEGSPGPSCA
jgi:hypothetical protein